MKYLGIIIIFLAVVINLIKDWRGYVIQRKKVKREYGDEPRKIFKQQKDKNKKSGLIFYLSITVLYLVGFFLEGAQVLDSIKRDSRIADTVNYTKNTSDSIHHKTSTAIALLDSTILKISEINEALYASANDINGLRNLSQKNFFESKMILSNIDSQSVLLSNKLPGIIYVDLEITWSITSASSSFDNYIKKINLESLDDKILFSTQRRFVISEKAVKYYPILFMAFKHLRFLFSKNRDSVSYIVNIHPQSLANFKSGTRFYHESDFNIYRNADFIYDQGQKTLSFKIKNCPFSLFSVSSTTLSMLDINDSKLSILINRQEDGLGYELTDMQAEYLFAYGWYNTMSQGDLFKCIGKINFPGFSEVGFFTNSRSLDVKKISFSKLYEKK